LYVVVPKGFFPVQDTGVIVGVSEAPQSVSFAEMADRQQALARVILQDPAVESLSSFIGIDGSNTTLNSGRILVNLKPLAQRRVSASQVIRRLQPELGKLDRITLFMQPVQDLTVEDRVSRTQYQYTLEDPDLGELNGWAPRLVDALRARPELAAISRLTETTGPLVITRQGQFPAVTLSFNVAPGVALGGAVAAVQEATRGIGLPASIRGSFQGSAQAFLASLANEPLLILAAL